MNTLATTPFVLASSSPNRAELLHQAGIPFTIVPADIDETPRSEELPEDMVRRLSREKAVKVASLCPDAYVIGADTTVVLDNQSIGKPENEGEAYRMIRLLSGREHCVLTGMSVVSSRDLMIESRLSESFIDFRLLSETEIRRYLTYEEWKGRAGAYGLQGRASSFVRTLRGSVTGIIGLDIAQLMDVLAMFS
jgi:septum formation protein